MEFVIKILISWFGNVCFNTGGIKKKNSYVPLLKIKWFDQITYAFIYFEVGWNI